MFRLMWITSRKAMASVANLDPCQRYHSYNDLILLYNDNEEINSVFQRFIDKTKWDLVFGAPKLFMALVLKGIGYYYVCVFVLCAVFIYAMINTGHYFIHTPMNLYIHTTISNIISK